MLRVGYGVTQTLYPAGDEWVAEQLISSLKTRLPARLGEIRTQSNVSVGRLPDPVSYWPEERFALMEQLNVMPAVMVVVGTKKLLGRHDVQHTRNVQPFTTPGPAGSPIFLWRSNVRVVIGVHLDQQAQYAQTVPPQPLPPPPTGVDVDDWTLTTRMRSRYSVALTRAILGHQEIVPDVLSTEENSYTISPGGAADPSLNRRYAETIHDFTVIFAEPLDVAAIGFVDPTKLSVTTQIRVP